MQNYERKACAQPLGEIQFIRTRQNRQTRSTEEDEENLQEAYENNNYHQELDPEDFALDRGWWYRCRFCDGNTRVTTRIPRCRHCGFHQSIQRREESA